MYGVDDLADAALEDAVRRGIGHHQPAQLRGVFFGLGFEVVDVDVALGVARHRDDLHACHGGRRGVRAVRRGGDQDDVAVPLPLGLVVGADDHQPCVFARGARIGLQRAGGQSGDRGQVAFERGDQLHVTFGLFDGCEGVHVLEPGQRQGLHECRRVEFHRARPQRDHRVGQRDVAVFQPLDVAHQRAFAAVRAEDLLGEDRRGAAQRFGQRARGVAPGDFGFASPRLGEEGHDLGHLVGGGHLVEREAHALLGGVEEVDAPFEGERLDDGRFGLDVERIEEVLVRELVAQRREGAGGVAGGRVGRLGSTAQAFGAVVDAVEAHHRGHQRRGGADVRGGALALDMLLAHLQRHAQGAVAQPVNRDADDAAGHLTFVGLARGHVARVRAAEAHGRAQALRRTDADVGAPFAGSFQQCQREQVGYGRHLRIVRVRRFDEGRVVAHGAIGGRILHDSAELFARELVAVVVVDDELDAERLAAREQQVERLREEVAVDEELRAPLLHRVAAAQGEHHEHRLGRRRPLVEQRAVGDFHAREREHGGLEIEQRFQTPLRDFGLVGGVGGVPRGILEDVARHGGRYGAGVVAHADERPQRVVAVGQRTDMCGEFVFAHARRQVERFFQPDRLGDHLRDQFVDASDTDRVEHGFEFVGIADADMAVSECIKRHCRLYLKLLYLFRLSQDSGGA